MPVKLAGVLPTSSPSINTTASDGSLSILAVPVLDSRTAFKAVSFPFLTFIALVHSEYPSNLSSTSCIPIVTDVNESGEVPIFSPSRYIVAPDGLLSILIEPVISLSSADKVFSLSPPISTL